MSSDKKDVALKILSKELLKKQIQGAEDFIQEAQQHILRLQSQIQQNLGVAGLAKHLLETFELPDKVEEPKNDKPSLEVK